jgi:hypothetical protein
MVEFELLHGTHDLPLLVKEIGLLTLETLMLSSRKNLRRGEITLLDISNMGSLRGALSFYPIY